VRRRQGFALVLVVLVTVIVSVVGGGLHFRLQRVRATVVREQSLVACRLLADSGIDWIRGVAARGQLKATDSLDMPSGKIGYAVDSEKTDPEGRRVRDAVVYGLSGRYRRVVALKLVLDSPQAVGGPPGVADAELPTDVSAADLGAIPPASGAGAALIAKAHAAARATPP
jgi:type II secretory pathway pseudopilin PulG